jgi:hypothetical protein
MIFRDPEYVDSQQEIALLISQVERLDDMSLLDEMTEINREISDYKLKDILFEYNTFLKEDSYQNYILDDDNRKYLENLYILFYTEITLHEQEGAKFVYEPKL